MSTTDVLGIAFLVILVVVVIAVLWGKDVKAAFNSPLLGSFSVEAREPKHRRTTQQRNSRRGLPEA